MNRKKDIEALLSRADKTRQKVFAEYEKALDETARTAYMRLGNSMADVHFIGFCTSIISSSGLKIL